MGSITAISVINKAKVITQDLKDVFWPVSEPLDWLNAGQRDIAVNRPDVSSTLESHTCLQGPTQTIPADGLRFLDCTHNLATGYVITPINRKDLDVVQRNWQRKDTDADEVYHYVFDERFPKQFKLYPAPALGVLVEIGFSKSPTPVTLSAFDGTDVSPISIDDTYEMALVYFVLAMLFQKKTNVTAHRDKVTQYYSMYYQTLGVKFNADSLMSANNPVNKED